MTKLVPDELWKRVEPLLPEHIRSSKGGRRPVDDRVALSGIIFVLRTGIPWRFFPQEMGCSGMTCWRRLRDWQASGVWSAIQKLFLNELRREEKLDFRRPLSMRA